jgi:3'-5' exoribonuclease
MDKDLLIAGCLLHDIGKLKEFEMTTSIRVTDEGMLVGHVTIGAEMLQKAMDKLATPKELQMKLTHMILTHMGEYGSSKKPSLPEALALFYADQASAQITHMITLKEEAATDDDYIYNKDLGNIYLK